MNYSQHVYNVDATPIVTNADVPNVVSNSEFRTVFHPITVDNGTGIVVELGVCWSEIEYHEGRIIVYRDKNGRISVVEIEYDDE